MMLFFFFILFLPALWPYLLWRVAKASRADVPTGGER